MRCRNQTLHHHRRGFTLIEVLIVVLILGLLAAIMIPQFADSADSAQESVANASLKTVRSQVELYWFNNGVIPTLADLENGYLAGFQQPEGYCIAIDAATGEVTLSQGDCAP